MEKIPTLNSAPERKKESLQNRIKNASTAQIETLGVMLKDPHTWIGLFAAACGSAIASAAKADPGFINQVTTAHGKENIKNILRGIAVVGSALLVGVGISLVPKVTESCVSSNEVKA